jgi:hypothetical protein
VVGLVVKLQEKFGLSNGSKNSLGKTINTSHAKPLMKNYCKVVPKKIVAQVK